MPTSIDDLLRHTSVVLSSSTPDEQAADAAAAAVGHLGRALGSLTQADAGRDDQGWRELAVLELTRACRAVGVQLTSAPGHVVDLAAVAADGIATAAPGLGDDERWAVAVEVARTVGVAAGAATRFVPYADVPALRRVGRLTAVVRQVAAADPPTVQARAVLDVPIAGDTGNPAGLPEAAAALVTSVDRSVRTGEFTVAAALTACAAAQAVAERAATMASLLAGRANPHGWSPVPDAWRALQATLRRFDDGSRYAIPTATRVTDAALVLHASVETVADRVAGWSEDAVTQMRYAANQLPVIAHHVETAMTVSARSGRVFALARTLPFSEDRVSELLRNRAALARPPDLVAGVMVAREATKLSAALAIELDRSAGVVGRQPQPHLIRAHLASLSSATQPSSNRSRYFDVADRHPARLERLERT